MNNTHQDRACPVILPASASACPCPWLHQSAGAQWARGPMGGWFAGKSIENYTWWAGKVIYKWRNFQQGSEKSKSLRREHPPLVGVFQCSMENPSNTRTNQGIFQPSLITRVYKKNLNLQRSIVKNIWWSFGIGGHGCPGKGEKKRRQKYHNHGKVSILISKNHPKTIAVIHLPVQNHPKCRMLKKNLEGHLRKRLNTATS